MKIEELIRDGLELSPNATRAVEAITASEIVDVVGFIEKCGYSVRTFFEFGVFDGIDFRPSNLRNVSFRGSSLCGCKFYFDQLIQVRSSKPRDTRNLVVSDRGDESETEDAGARPRVVSNSFLEYQSVLLRQRGLVEKGIPVDAKKLENAIRSIKDPSETFSAVCKYISVLNSVPSSTLLTIAASISKEVRVQSTEAQSWMADLLIDLCSLGALEERFEALQGVFPHSSSIPSLIQAYIGSTLQSSEELVDAISLFDKISWQVLKELGEGPVSSAKNLPEVIKIATSLEGKGIPVVTATCVRMLKLCSSLDDALNVLGFTIKSGITVSSNVASSTVRFCSSVDELIVWLGVLTRGGIKPTGNAIASNLALMKSVGEAHDLIKALIACEIEDHLKDKLILLQSNRSVPEIQKGLALILRLM